MLVLLSTFSEVFDGVLSTSSLVLVFKSNHIRFEDNHKMDKCFRLHKTKQYMLKQNCLCCSVQLKTARLLTELFSALSTLWKWQILMKSQDKGIFINFGCLFFIWNTDITRMCSWFWAKWCNYFNVSCSVVELFKHRNHKNLAFNGLTPQKATLLLTNLFSTNNKSACVVVLEAILKCLTLGLRGIFARGWESAEALLIALVLEALNPVLGLIPDMYNNSAICAQCMCISWLK